MSSDSVDIKSNDSVLEKIEQSIVNLDLTAKLPDTTALQEWLGKKFVETDIVNLFEQAPDGICVIESAGLIVSVNSRMEELFGWRRLELLGKSVALLVPENLVCRHEEGRQAFFSHPVNKPLDIGIATFGKHKDGSTIPVSITFSFVKTHYEVLGTAFIRLRKLEV